MSLAKIGRGFRLLDLASSTSLLTANRVSDSGAVMVDVGSAEVSERIEEARRRYRSGESVLVLIESSNGSVGPIEENLLGGLEVLTRVMCASACQAESGALADQIGQEAGGAVVIENAQWADPTSLGRLQRMLRSDRPMPLVVLAHQPMTGLESWGIDQLAKTFRESGHVVSLSADGASAADSGPELAGSSFDLVAACSLLTRPVAVADAARVLEISEEEVLELGHDLASAGLLREVRGGYSATPGGASAVVGHEARVGRVAGRLADTLADSGATEALIGSLRFDAGQHEMATDLLVHAADQAAARHQSGEAFRLASMALEAAGEAGSEGSRDLGRMHLICARFLRAAGRTQWAIDHADRAVSTVDGGDRVASLHLAAVLADDQQRPQDAEHLIAIAEWESIRAKGESSLAALLAFRSRTLNRIGFAEEADDTLRKADALAAQGSEEARFDVQTNKAWIHFDRGELSRAEIEFTHLRDESERFGGRDAEADKEAWRARSLLPSGHPVEALEAIDAAQEIARTEGVEAPLFLSDLAIAEGSIMYGRLDEALAAAERALDLVNRQLPAWENMALATRARVHLAARDWSAARSDLNEALEHTPEGANGWRWRTRCRALQLEVDAASGTSWREDEAEDLADLLLQAKLYGWAAEALCVIAENGGRESSAADAMNLALSIGQPMLAARATHAGDLWDDPRAAAIILAMRAVDHRVPEGWRQDWETLPHVAAALSAPVPEEDPDLEAVAESLNSALAGAGLTREAPILSPSQRRNRGLVAGHRPSPGRRRLWAVAAALGVIVLAAGTAFGVTQLGRDEPEAAPDDTAAATGTAPPTTAPSSLEETQIPVPSDVDFFFGTSVHRGTYQRPGVVDVSGPREVNGYYWRFQTAGPIEAPPVVFGTTVFVGTTEGTFFALDQTTGDELWTLPPEGRIGAAPALGEGEMAENRAPMMIVVVDDDGAVRGHDAAVPTGVQWTTRLGSRIRSSPVVVDGRVFLATDDGFVHALDLIEGTEMWRYPAEGPDLGTISADLAFHDGILYVATEEGVLHLLDVAGDAPSLVCEFDAVDPIVTNPIVTDEVTYVATMGQSIWPLPTGACDGSVPNRLPAYITDTPVRVGPAVVGDTIYMPGGRYLYSIDLTSGEHLWEPSTVTADSPISTPPVVTADAIYFASEDGVVHAVDLASGETLWQWQTGLHVRAAPAVVDGVVFVAAGDGYVYALGP